jgi:DNA-binding winged helix-turn-helix (wHTH) protein
VKFEFCGFRYDTASRQLLDGQGNVVPLPQRATDALEMFLRRPGVLLGKKHLIATLWPTTSVGANSLDQLISRLRRALSSGRAGSPTIVADKGRGYRFTAQVRAVDDAPSSSGSESESTVATLYQQAHTLIVRASPANFEGALGLLNAALEREPNHALALAERALLRTLFVTFDLPMADALNLAEREARRGLELQPGLWRAHHALAYVLIGKGQWSEAREHYDAACNLEPEPEARITRVWQLAVTVGHLRLAKEWASQALDSSPVSPLSAVAMATVCNCLGLDSEAQANAERAAELGWPRASPPLLDIQLLSAFRRRDYTEVGRCIRMSLDPRVLIEDAARVPEAIAAGLSDPGLRLSAVRALDSLVSEPNVHRLGPLNFKRTMLWFALLGSPDGAHRCMLRLLDRLATRHSVGGPWDSLWVPEMHFFRQDPRFQSVIRRLGFSGYWQDFGAPDLEVSGA